MNAEALQHVATGLSQDMICCVRVDDTDRILVNAQDAGHHQIASAEASGFDPSTELLRYSSNLEEARPSLKNSTGQPYLLNLSIHRGTLRCLSIVVPIKNPRFPNILGKSRVYLLSL